MSTPAHPDCGLWSLRDMLDFQGAPLINSMVWIQRTLVKAEASNPLEQISSEVANNVKISMQQFREFCQKYSLDACEVYASVIEFRAGELNWNVLKDNLKNLQYMLSDAFIAGRFLHLSLHEATFYNVIHPLGEKGTIAFPAAIYDAQEAANCYAVSRYTASVFHAMRALEHGLMALAVEVGRHYDKQQWYNIINEIESEIDRVRKSGPKSPEKDERLQFYSAAAKEFAYFKDGWRNYVTHARAKYDQLTAESAIKHAQSFMMQLADGLSSTSLATAAEIMIGRV